MKKLAAGILILAFVSVIGGCGILGHHGVGHHSSVDQTTTNV